MATLTDLQRRTKEYLYSATPNERPFVHLINGAITNVATSVVVDDGDNFSPMDIIEFEDGEQCLVTSVSTNTLTVVRGWAGTTAAAQDDNSVIYVNPRFTLKQMEETLLGVVRELRGHGIYSWGEGSLVLVNSQYKYDLAHTDILNEVGVVSVHYEDTAVFDEIRSLPFQFQRTHSTIAPATLFLWEWGNLNGGDTVYYIYAQEIDSVTDLLARQEELVVNGAVARLLGATLAPRTHDPGKYSDRTVQPGQGLRDARFFQAEFYLAIRRESALLAGEAQSWAQSNRTARARRYRR